MSSWVITPNMKQQYDETGEKTGRDRNDDELGQCLNVGQLSPKEF